MKVIYPYQKWQDASLPLVPVSLGKAGVLYAIVDSGANVSLFQYEVAELLGLSVRKGKKIPLSGIGGSIQGYLHRVPINVGGHSFYCHVCFSKELRVPLNLLGRADFFRQFRVTFEEAKQIIILEKI